MLVRSLETQRVPPTVNLEEVDPRIGLDALPVARDAPMRTALKTSSGLGGLNAALVVGARR